MPTLDALRGSSPEADLYAARCVLQLRGCAAATAQLEAVAQQYPGSATGTRARNEAAACNRALSETDRPAATTGPGTPAAAKPSSPRAVPAEPARQ
jgi:hypothetical protein